MSRDSDRGYRVRMGLSFGKAEVSETLPLNVIFPLCSDLKKLIEECLTRISQDKEGSLEAGIKKDFEKKFSKVLFELIKKGGYGDVDLYIKSREELSEHNEFKPKIKKVDANLQALNKATSKLFEDIKEIHTKFQAKTPMTVTKKVLETKLNSTQKMQFLR